MIIRLYAINDVLNGFATPVMMPNDATALRWFQDMCEENPSMKNHREDFTVHYIAQMDSETGDIIPSPDVYKRKCLTQIPIDEERGE